MCAFIQKELFNSHSGVVSVLLALRSLHLVLYSWSLSFYCRIFFSLSRCFCNFMSVSYVSVSEPMSVCYSQSLVRVILQKMHTVLKLPKYWTIKFDACRTLLRKFALWRVLLKIGLEFISIKIAKKFMHLVTWWKTLWGVSFTSVIRIAQWHQQKLTENIIMYSIIFHKTSKAQRTNKANI